MEIRIRTHEELRADRVTVEITGTGAEVTEFAETRLPSRNLYTDEEVANLQASEAELVADPLRRRIAELERTLAESRELVAFKDTVIQSTNKDFTAELERSAHFRRRAEDAENKLMNGHVCTGGCSGDQHVAFVGRQALTRMENQVAELTRRIDNARVLLSDARVVEARNKSVTTLETVLGGAIGKALDTLG